MNDHIMVWVLWAGSLFTSRAVISDGNCYGIPKGVGFSFPCITKNFDYKIVDNLELDEFTKKKLEINYKEIKDELSLVGFEI